MGKKSLKGLFERPYKVSLKECQRHIITAVITSSVNWPDIHTRWCVEHNLDTLSLFDIFLFQHASDPSSIFIPENTVIRCHALVAGTCCAKEKPMPEIEIRCPECGMRKTMPSDRIPNRPIKVNCKRCAHSFVFNKAKERNKRDTKQQSISPPPQKPPVMSEPIQTKVATENAEAHADSSDPEMGQTQAPPKKKSQALIAGLLLVIIALVPLRIWLTNQANSTPYPNWMATSPHGIAVLFGDQFHVLDYQGNIKWSKELPGDADPCQISWQGEDVWVSDFKNDRILQYDGNGMIEVALIDSGIEVHMNVAVNPIDSNLYISDSQASRIKIFNDNGEYVDEFGETGYSDGSLRFPKDITFNDKGQLVIGNTMRSSVDVFSPEGTYVETLVKHDQNPFDNLKDISPEALKDVSVEKLANLFNQPYIFDFALNSQHLITIECNQLITECAINSYTLDGEVLSSIDHKPGTDTEGDVAVWQDKLYVTNCENRNIDVYDASTLSHQGAFSSQIDQIGMGYQKQAGLFLVTSKVLLYLMIIGLISIIWLYVRSKRS